jgi:peptide/nickel transport system permease protein
MKTRAGRVLARFGRVASLVLVAALGTITLMRFAPGYFTDVRELDSEYGNRARAALEIQQGEQRSLVAVTERLLGGWLHGDLGRSRQYDIPVTELMGSRAKVSGLILLRGMGYGWALAIVLALPLSARRTSGGEAVIAAPSAVLLAIPIAAMATTCLIWNLGGPVLVLTTLVGVRDFKAIYRLLRHTWRSPYLLYARSQGIRSSRVALVYLIPALTRELIAVAVTSFVIALSAIVPVEVVFDVPGLGQLAWSAAMNRDLPVLLAVTLVVAACVGLAGMISPGARALEAAPCA